MKQKKKILRPRKLKDEIIQLFAAIKGGLDGYWKDEIPIDKVIVESKYCPKCHQYLEYRSYSNIEFNRVFGICEKCEYAKEFYLNPPFMTNFKKAVGKRTAAAVGKKV